MQSIQKIANTTEKEVRDEVRSLIYHCNFLNNYHNHSLCLKGEYLCCVSAYTSKWRNNCKPSYNVNLLTALWGVLMQWWQDVLKVFLKTQISCLLVTYGTTRISMAIANYVCIHHALRLINKHIFFCSGIWRTAWWTHLQ